ncbi:MAG: hypothetical protein AB201_01900 [Parcubacteria bacterium C7867-006]|nr:MAG: hypothetical protein AB201_01900 [Parcubacteria bacterium C7867-006]
MPIALILLLLLGGGTGIVAENSLPGDILYSVKIHINENIESAIALTAKSDAEVSVRQAARRLVEAEQLKEKGKLSAEQSIEIKDSFLKEVSLINENVQKIKAKGDSKSADEINGKLEKEIKDHSEIAGTLGVEDDDSDDNGEDNKTATTSVKKEGGSSVSKSSDSSRRDSDDEDENESEDDDDDDRRVSNTTTVTTTPAGTTNSDSSSTTLPKYTLAQVALHNKSSDCWSAVSGGVYNLTSWISQHPGGASAIIGLCGIDGTAGFTAQHGGQGNPAKELASFKIGVLK